MFFIFLKVDGEIVLFRASVPGKSPPLKISCRPLLLWTISWPVPSRVLGPHLAESPWWGPGAGKTLVKTSEPWNTQIYWIRISEGCSPRICVWKNTCGDSFWWYKKLENHPTKCSQFILKFSIIAIKLFSSPPCCLWEGASLRLHISSTTLHLAITVGFGCLFVKWENLDSKCPDPQIKDFPYPIMFISVSHLNSSWKHFLHHLYLKTICQLKILTNPQRKFLGRMGLMGDWML